MEVSNEYVKCNSQRSQSLKEREKHESDQS